MRNSNRSAEYALKRRNRNKSPDPAHKQKSIYGLTTKGIDLYRSSQNLLHGASYVKSLAKAGKDIQNDMKKKLSKERL